MAIDGSGDSSRQRNRLNAVGFVFLALGFLVMAQGLSIVAVVAFSLAFVFFAAEIGMALLEG